MVPSARVLALARLGFLLVAGRATVVFAQTDTAVLEFLGFRAGASLEELSAQLERVGGGPLRCERARVDRRVMECRAVLREPDGGNAVQLWASAIDSASSVITLAAAVPQTQLDRWQQTLEERYGRVGARVQGTQRMLQWVRRGRMLRLTWRLEGTGKVASVSLVDGRVLDNWGRARAASPASATRSQEPRH